MKIRTLLTDNAREFTDRSFGNRAKDASGEPGFQALCRALGVEHRLINPQHPHSNGTVEHFNVRVAQLLDTQHFVSVEALEQSLHRFVWLHNYRVPQKSLHDKVPIQALKLWQQTPPNFSARQLKDRPGPDT